VSVELCPTHVPVRRFLMTKFSRRDLRETVIEKEVVFRVGASNARRAAHSGDAFVLYPETEDGWVAKVDARLQDYYRARRVRRIEQTERHR